MIYVMIVIREIILPNKKTTKEENKNNPWNSVRSVDPYDIMKNISFKPW